MEENRYGSPSIHLTSALFCNLLTNTLYISKIMIPAIWYNILKLKKVEVVAQLTARKISFQLTQHHMTLKSKLYQSIKNFVESLRSQFNKCIGNNWVDALRASGKTFKEFKRNLLRTFHPDLHNGCAEATEITQTINGWEEPSQFDDKELDMFMQWYERQAEEYRKQQEEEERWHQIHLENTKWFEEEFFV